jgi:hypothetical protein
MRLSQGRDVTRQKILLSEIGKGRSVCLIRRCAASD